MSATTYPELEAYVQDPLAPQKPNVPYFAGEDQVPAHVPKELVKSCGLMFSPEFLAAPHDFMAAMQDNYPPIFYDVTPYRNSWFLTKHEDCLFVLRHADIFRNLEASPFPREADDYFFFIPQEVDPPHHRKYRNIVDPVFCPAGIKQIEGLIRQRAIDIIDGFVGAGECNFNSAFGRPLPVSVFLDIMGLPQDMRDTFVEWGDTMIHSQDPAEVGAAFAKAIVYLRGAIAEKQANPDGGVVSLIANAEIDGRKLTDKEVFGFVSFLWIGGLDTVYAALNNIWLWLAQNPDRVAEIIADPGNINAQVEELLRVHSVTFSGRTVAQDTELRGIKLKKGDKITSVLPACNFDPDVFPNPTEEEQRYLNELAHWTREETGYQWIQGTRPQTLAFGLTDSPAGLAAWIKRMKFESGFMQQPPYKN